MGREGTSVSIVATVSANPAPTRLNWKKAGNDTVLSTNRILLIENATNEDAGDYILEATRVRQRENNITEDVTKNVSVHLEIRREFTIIMGFPYLLVYQCSCIWKENTVLLVHVFVASDPINVIRYVV